MVETGELGLTTASHVARLPGPLRCQMLERIEHEHLSSRVVHIKVNELLRERPVIVDVDPSPVPARLPASDAASTTDRAGGAVQHPTRRD